MKLVKPLLTAFFVLTIAPMDFAIGEDASPFDANIDGVFAVTGGIGDSPLFVVEESGAGEETTLGTFTYTTYLLHNLARRPEICDTYYSSTAVDGFAVLDFADGQVRLKRASGISCFAYPEFPNIHIEERWKIASGTGAYIGATGKLLRVFDGDFTNGLGQGTFQGTIK